MNATQWQFVRKMSVVMGSVINGDQIKAGCSSSLATNNFFFSSLLRGSCAVKRVLLGIQPRIFVA